MMSRCASAKGTIIRLERNWYRFNSSTNSWAFSLEVPFTRGKL